MRAAVRSSALTAIIALAVASAAHAQPTPALDLAVLDLSTRPPMPTGGARAEVVVTVGNLGTEPSPDSSLCVSATWNGMFNAGRSAKLFSLAPGQITSPTFMVVEVPEGAGVLELEASVDCAQELAESDETNNRRVARFRTGGDALELRVGEVPVGYVARPYSLAMTAVGGASPYRFFAAGLPPGLAVRPDGDIAGTPTVGGTFDVEARVADSIDDSAVARFVITVIDEALPLEIVAPELAPASIGEEYCARARRRFEARGGRPPYSWQGRVLPAGLRVEPDGALCGVPQGPAGAATVELAVWDGVGTGAIGVYELTLVEELSLRELTPPIAQVGQPYAFELQVQGGTPPYAFAATAGALPAGLTLSAEGAIHGTPEREESRTLAVEVSDAAGASASGRVRVEVRAGPSGREALEVIEPVGCGCASTRASATAWAAWVVLAVLVRRRR